MEVLKRKTDETTTKNNKLLRSAAEAASDAINKAQELVEGLKKTKDPSGTDLTSALEGLDVTLPHFPLQRLILEKLFKVSMMLLSFATEGIGPRIRTRSPFINTNTTQVLLIYRCSYSLVPTSTQNLNFKPPNYLQILNACISDQET